MQELNVFKEIPGGEKFHSCILACYSLDYYFFEQRIVRTLRSKGIRNISVITDARIAEEYQKNMMGNVKKISSLYSLTSIVSNGAFHPKLYLFFGDHSILMIAGSGNLTSGGMGKNHELFITFYADLEKKEQLPVILNGWNYLKGITDDTKGITHRQQKWIVEYCSLLKNNIKAYTTGGSIPLGDNKEASFLHNSDTSIWAKAKQQIDNPGSINKITIASPFFDKNGVVLDKFVKHFPNAKIEVFVQDTDVLLPVDFKKTSSVRFYKWDDTDVAVETKFKKNDRFQHSKIFHFQAASMEYLLMGSPNATSPALLQTAAEGNTEAAILLKGRKANWLTQLGITGKKIEIDIKLIPIKNSRNAETDKERLFKFKIKAIDRYSKEFMVYLNKEAGHDYFIRLSDAYGDLVDSKPVPGHGGLEWKIKLQNNNLAEQVVFGTLYDKNDLQVSNSQVINNVSALETLHPSPENRRINKLIDKMMEGKYSELDLFDFYEAIRAEKKHPKKELLLKRSHQTISKDSHKSAISYEEALENRQRDQSVLHLEDFEPVRIWDIYFAKLEQELRAREEEDIDDEEEGDLRSGKGREEKEKKKKPFESKNVFEKAQRRVSHLFETYITGLTDSTCDALEKKGNYEVTLSDYAFFLLAATHLIDITGKKYSYKDKKEEIKEEVLLPFIGPLDEYCSFNSIAVDVIGKFLLFLHNAEREKNYTDEYEVKKMQHFRQMAWNKVVTILAIINLKCRIKEEKYWDKWCITLLLNASHILQPSGLQVKDILRKEFSLMNMVNLSIDLGIQHITHLYRKALSIINTNPLQQKMERILFTNQLGYCYIEEVVPPGGETKFYRVSHPGLEFADDDFIAEKLYSVERGVFLSSFRRLGEIFNR